MDMLLTDPPYNVALGYYDNLDEAKKRHRCTDGLLIANDNFEDEGEFTDFLYRSFSNASSVMKKGGAFYIWMASLQSHNFVEACKRTGWQIRQ